MLLGDWDRGVNFHSKRFFEIFENIFKEARKLQDRKAELEKLCNELESNVRLITSQLIDEIVFLERQLTILKEYPFISVNPNNPVQQKATYAGKQYKEMLQQYNNSIKIMLSAVGKNKDDKNSPLREYLKQMQERG